MGPLTRAALWCTALVCLLQLAAAQFGGMPGMGMPEQPKAHAVKSDVQYIKCQACEALVKQAYRHTKTKREGLKPHQKLSESDIIEHLEQMCDPSKPEGQWISHYDIVEKGTELKLVDTGKPSKCNVECMTIARACAQVADELDLSDLSEALFKGAKRSALSSEACHESTDVCRKKPPPVPKDRKLGPAHVPMSAEELQREQMMASMKAAGLGGQMFSRDDVMSQLGGLTGEDTSSQAEAKPASVAEGLQEKVAQVKESVEEVVVQAKEAAAAVVDKAGSFLKDSLSKISSSFKGKEAGDAEL